MRNFTVGQIVYLPSAWFTMIAEPPKYIRGIIASDVVPVNERERELAKDYVRDGFLQDDSEAVFRCVMLPCLSKVVLLPEQVFRLQVDVEDVMA